MLFSDSEQGLRRGKTVKMRNPSEEVVHLCCLLVAAGAKALPLLWALRVIREELGGYPCPL